MTASTASANAMSVAVGIAQPPAASPPRLTSDVAGRRGRHATDRGGDRHRGPARVAEVTGDELALEFQPSHEEEDRQQAVGGPLGPALRFRCHVAGPRCSVAQRHVAVAPAASSPRSGPASGGRDSSRTPPTVSHCGCSDVIRDTSGHDPRPNSERHRMVGCPCGYLKAVDNADRRPGFPAHQD